MDRAEEWAHALREIAKDLDDKQINIGLDQWPRVYHRAEERLVVFTGRRHGATPLIGRLIPLRDGRTEYAHEDAQVIPPGMRWLNATPYDAASDLDNDLRRSDAVVLSVPAISAANTSDVELLRDRVVRGAHVPHTQVVITDADELRSDELDVIIRYVRRTLGRISPRVVVTLEPPVDDPDRQAWLAGLCGDPSPRRRVGQALAQLRDLAADLERVALTLAEQADAESRADDSRLSDAETHAERLLDVAAVRRQLRARQRASAESAVVRGKQSVAELGAQTRRSLHGARGDQRAIEEALTRFHERADSALAAAHDAANATLRSDAAWLNERLAAYAEAWEVAYSESVSPGLAAAGAAGTRRTLPPADESSLLKKIAGPIGKLAAIAVRVAIDEHASGATGKAGEDLARGQRLTRNLAGKGASEASTLIGDVIANGIVKVAEQREARRRVAAAESIVDEVCGALATEADQLGTAILRAYDAIAAQFDHARHEWRDTQRVRAIRRLTELGDRWRSVAADVSTVRDSIDAELAAEERN